MKGIWLALIVYLPAKFVTGQITAEQINTKNKMLQFLTLHYFKPGKMNHKIDYYNNSYFKNGSIDKKTSKYFLKNNKYHWLILDLNNDRKQDLVWNGCIDKEATVLVFISEDANKYAVIKLSNEEEVDVFHLILPFKNDAFIVTRIDPLTEEWGSYAFGDRFITDTVYFRNNNFIEYNSLNASYNTDTIKYYKRGLFTFRDEWIKISKEGHVMKRQYLKTDSIERYITMEKDIESDSAKLFFSTVNQLPFYSFKNSYRYVSNTVRDAFTHHFEFIFAGGDKKKISTYYNCSLFGFKLLADFFNRLDKSENWKINEQDMRLIRNEL